MKDLDEHSRMCEEAFGLISGTMIHMLHEHSTAAGSKWDISDPDTTEIIVTANNADSIYAICKEIRSGYSVGITKAQMKKVKAARAEAHRYLFEEANNPNTSIQRKIELVRLTSKGG
jgi:hypothetical protein